MTQNTSLKLGRFGKEGNVEIATLKGGIKKEEVSSELKNVFAAYDEDNNNVLTDNEIQKLKSDVEQYSKGGKDSIFSQREANHLSKDKNIQDTDSSKIFDFLKQIETRAKSMISSEVAADGKVVTKSKDGNGNEVTETYDNNTKISEKVVSANGKTIKTISKNGIKEKEIISDDTTGTVETTTFGEDGETIVSKEIKEKSQTTTISYEQGRRKSEKVITDKDEQFEYTYDASGDKKITKKIENSSDVTKRKVTEYKYNSNGSYTETINDYTGTTVISYDKNKQELSRSTTKNGQTTVLTKVENGYTETITNDKNDNSTTNILNNNKQRLTQTKTVDNKEYSLTYDGEGNITGVVVQFGENINSICKKFGCTKEELLEVNKDIVKTTKSGRKYFAVGAEIKIPDKNYRLDADNKVFQNRKDSAGAIQDYKNWKAEQERIRKSEDEELAGRKGHERTFIEQKWNTFEEMARAYYKREGISKPSARQIQLRVQELKKLNPTLQDGQIKGKRVIATFNAETDASIGAGQQKRESARIASKHKKEAATGKNLAKIMYSAMDDHAGGVSEDDFQEALGKVNANNVVGLLKQYNQLSPDETLIESIMDETGNTLKTRKEAITKIVNSLIQRANNAGVSDARQKQAIDACKQELKSYWSLGIGYCQTSQLDGLINNLIGAIDAAEALTHEEKTKLSGNGINETVALMNNQLSSNTEALNKQLAEDGWCADLYEGLKWCVGSDNLDEKVKADLEKYKGYISQLQKAEKEGGEAGFKAKFKEIFGVEYDPNLIKGYNKLQSNFAMAQGLTIQKQGFYAEFGKSMNGQESYASMRNKYGEYLKGAANGQIKDGGEAVDNVIAIELKKQGIDIKNATQAQKQEALKRVISNTYGSISSEVEKYTNGQSLDSMKKQLDNAGSAVFGNKHDITFRVNDYISSQQQGGAAVNMAVKAAAAIAITVATGGAGLAALTTAAALTATANAAIDLTDRVSSDVGLKDGEVVEILKNAAVDGASVFAGGMVGKYAMMFKNANAFVQAGGRLTLQAAGDVATGAAAEYIQTGTITLEGVAFQAVFSAAGNLISLKSLGKADTPNPKPTPSPEPKPTPTPVPKPKTKPQTESVLERISKNTKERSVGRLSETNYKALTEEVKAKLENISTESDLDALKSKIELLQNREQRRALQNLIEQKRSAIQINNPAPVPEPKPAPAPEPKPAPAPEPKPAPAPEPKPAPAPEPKPAPAPEPKPAPIPEIPESPTIKTPHTQLERGQSYELHPDAKLKIGEEILDMENLPAGLKNKIDALQDGQEIKIGRQDINPNDLTISSEHLIIKKENGKLKVIDTSTNGTIIMDTANVQAYRSVQQLKNGNEFLNSIEFIKLEKQFLKTFDGDYTLLNKLLTSDKIDINSHSFKNIMSSTNKNNSVILEQFLNNPSSIKKGSIMGSSITQEDLSMLMLFNRNNDNVSSLISSPSKVDSFLKRADKEIANLREVHGQNYIMETADFDNVSNTEIADAILYGQTRMSDGTIVECKANSNVLDDMENLIHGKDYIQHFSNNETPQSMFTKTSVGDVASINGQMFVNNGKEMVKLSLSENSFRELFPPVQRFAIHQGSVATCYLDTSINILANSKVGRAKLYQMIGEETQIGAHGPQKVYYTTTENSNGQKTYFERFTRHGEHMRDINGLAIIEQGYCKNSRRHALDHRAVTRIMKANAYGTGVEALKGLTGDYAIILHDKTQMMEKIKNLAGRDDVYMYAGSNAGNGLGHDHVVNAKYDVHQSHAYTVTGYDEVTNMVTIANPWHSGVDIPMPMDEFLRDFANLQIAQIM